MVEVRGSKSEKFYIREKKNDGTLWKNISIGAKFIRPGAFYTTTLNSDPFKLDSQNENSVTCVQGWVLTIPSNSGVINRTNLH